MDSHNDLLGELAGDAALERSDFLVQSTEQLRKFLDRHRERIATIGGLTLIDEEPDYLSIAPDLTFRSRSRYLDDVTGEWVSETEVIEPAVGTRRAVQPGRHLRGLRRGRTRGGRAGRRTDRQCRPARDRRDLDRGDPRHRRRGSLCRRGGLVGGRPGPEAPLDADDDEQAAHRLYDLALEYQEGSQRSEAHLLEQFEGMAANLISVIGDLVIVDDDDERLVLTATGKFRAEVVPEDSEGIWRNLETTDELVEFYDPTDVFGDLADALAEAYPSVAPELAGEGAEPGDAAARRRWRRRHRRGGRGRADRVTMRLAAAELVESREILPGQWLQSFHAPTLATGSRAGQFVHVRPGDLSGMVLRRPFSLNTTDPTTGIVTIHFRVIGRGTDWFTRLRPGDPVDMLGPLGHPFEVAPRSQHLLLIAGGLGMAGVRMLADEAIRDGRRVTLLFGASSARDRSSRPASPPPTSEMPSRSRTRAAAALIDGRHRPGCTHPASASIRRGWRASGPRPRGGAPAESSAARPFGSRKRFPTPARGRARCRTGAATAACAAQAASDASGSTRPPRNLALDDCAPDVRQPARTRTPDGHVVSHARQVRQRSRCSWVRCVTARPRAPA